LKTLNTLILGSLALSSSVAFGAGYYRESGTVPIYYVYPDDAYCWVEDLQLMELLGGEEQVKVVRDIEKYIGGKTYLENCAWPNGNYKAKGDSATWHNFGIMQTCWIKDTASLYDYGGPSSVIKTAYEADFTAHRKFYVSNPGAPYPETYACP